MGIASSSSCSIPPAATPSTTRDKTEQLPTNDPFPQPAKNGAEAAAELIITNVFPC
jgi:hypothetical protein